MATQKANIRLNRSGIRQFLEDQRSNPKMLARLEEEGQRLAAKAGPGFVAEPRRARWDRPGMWIKPATPQAYRDQAKHNLLGKALAQSVISEPGA